AGRPWPLVMSSQPVAKFVMAPDGDELVVDERSGMPVIGSVAIATTRAPIQVPKTPWSVSRMLFAHGLGHVLGTKSKPNGVSPIRNELSSEAILLQSGTGATSEKGRFFVAQHGWPQSSPSRIGMSFSRPPSSALASRESSAAKQLLCPRWQRMW